MLRLIESTDGLEDRSETRALILMMDVSPNQRFCFSLLVAITYNILAKLEKSRQA
jgi:hypothetical protein